MNAQVIQTSERMNGLKKSDLLRIYGPKYPHFRFSCPACGSLEVFISWYDKKSIEGKCLDCNHDWIADSRITKTEKSQKLD